MQTQIAETPVQPAPPPVVQKTYYSRIRGLQISAVKPDIIEVAGKRVYSGEKIIQFQPLGNSHFGSFTTSDPQLIALLDKQVQEVGDIMTPAQYSQAIVPPQQQIEELQNRLRQITEENALLKKLEAEGRLPKKQ